MILKNKKFLVIGGAGLIGSHTVDLLLRENVKEIIVFDNFFRGSAENLSEALKNPKVKFLIMAEIFSKDILEKSMSSIDEFFILQHYGYFNVMNILNQLQN